MKAEAKTQAQSYINDVMDEARLTASKEAKRIVINTIQRTASETAIENAVTVFHIESDEIKGIIIGREGRNIKSLEGVLGVDILIDDTPETIEDSPTTHRGSKAFIEQMQRIEENNSESIFETEEQV